MLCQLFYACVSFAAFLNKYVEGYMSILSWQSPGKGGMQKTSNGKKKLFQIITCTNYISGRMYTLSPILRLFSCIFAALRK